MITTGSPIRLCHSEDQHPQIQRVSIKKRWHALMAINRQAYVSFQKAVSSILKNKEAIMASGMFMAPCRGNSSKPRKSFGRPSSIDSDYSEAHTYLGQVLASQDRWKEAIASFRRALSNPLYGTPDLARFHLGRALLHEGDPSGAHGGFGRCVDGHPAECSSGPVQFGTRAGLLQAWS